MYDINAAYLLQGIRDRSQHHETYPGSSVLCWQCDLAVSRSCVDTQAIKMCLEFLYMYCRQHDYAVSWPCIQHPAGPLGATK